MASLRRGELETRSDEGLVLRRSELEALLADMDGMSADALRDRPGMDPRRVLTLPAATVIVREVLDTFGKDQLTTSERSLRDGLIVDWIRKRRPELALSETVPDPRRRSVLRMLERYNVETPHATQAARLALALFDGLADLHHLGIDDRRTLEFAAMLHDVGHYIAGLDHHRHGYYLVRNTQLPGFTRPEVEVIASIVHYHRGARPKRTHEPFKALDEANRHRVVVLSAIVQMADALDRGHNQVISELRTRIEPKRVLVRAVARDRAHLEHWAAARKCEVLAEALHRTVELELVEPETGDPAVPVG
jgi:exopolyphosphatase/guanosine-5'-triphosphate,3'-diphosphate pyrophosphatase